MPTNYKKREKLSSQCDAARGNQAMNRLVGVVRYEQRLQAKSGVQQQDASFNSQPQAGWKKDWKSTMSQKGYAAGLDVTRADEQDWLQGSRTCYDTKRAAPASTASGYPGQTSSSPGRVSSDAAASVVAAKKNDSTLPAPPALPEQISKASFQKYVEEVNAALAHTLSQSGIGIDADALTQYTRELAQSLRVLSKPAPAIQKTKICEAMAPVWDMRSNCPSVTEDPLDLRALKDALEALQKSFSFGDAIQPASNVDSA
eukprot:TRINITY_DN56225_c0_g1_i1.p1 TRINITY_DN56225_c0_g1~~TRINITY_DN56225_c0_g1_i1.p1  ORF type:complete len:258 (-),score=31.90 TRINITY_DN56225_c0_g1_i1:53-826(-)